MKKIFEISTNFDITMPLKTFFLSYCYPIYRKIKKFQKQEVILILLFKTLNITLHGVPDSGYNPKYILFQGTISLPILVTTLTYRTWVTVCSPSWRPSCSSHAGTICTWSLVMSCSFFNLDKTSGTLIRIINYPMPFPIFRYFNNLSTLQYKKYIRWKKESENLV